MPKILHTADLRLGAKFPGLGKAGDKVRAQLKRSWTAVVETALAERVDAVVAAGGLFDSPEISRPAVEFVLKEIARLGKVPVIMVPGVRDHMGKGSLYYHFDLLDRPENLFPITGAREILKFKELDLTVIAKPAVGAKSGESPLNGIKVSEPGASVVIASGNWKGSNHPITEADISITGATYVALGGEPAFRSGRAGETAYAFSGPPESQDFSHTGPAGVVLVDLAQKPAEVRFHPLGVLVWKEEKLDDSSLLENLLGKEKGENRILRVSLFGEKSPGQAEPEEIAGRYRDQFLFLSVKDERKSFAAVQKFPATTVAGQFFRLAEEARKKAGAEEKKLLEEVLVLGSSLLSQNPPPAERQ